MNIPHPRFLFLSFCLAVLLAGLYSCNKLKINPVRSLTHKDESSSSARLTPLPPFRGVYIDKFLSILGRQSGEDSLLDWCVNHDLNAISLYNAATVVGSSSSAAQLNSFIAKAKASPYNMQVALVATNQTISANEYTLYYKLYANKFNAITTEYEFWNSGKSYTVFKNHLKYLEAIRDSTGGVLERQVYVSQFEDAAGLVTDEPTIVQRMVKSSDKIFLVNYTNNSYNLSSTTLNKLKKLASAAKTLNKTINIVVLFNVNTGSSDPSIFDYVSVTGSNHPFIDAYDEFEADYSLAVFPYKSYINLIGFQIYRHSAAFQARPAIY